VVAAPRGKRARPPPAPRRPVAPASAGRARDARRELGAQGEALAAAHLRGCGFAIVARNQRTRHGEIDLIAFDGHTLVFAEVKTRRVPNAGPRGDAEPLLTVLKPRQRARLRRLSAAWLAHAGRRVPFAHTIRFDAIGVAIDGRGALQHLEHIPAAW
jgi:putative endonuclease